jgi:hypothetical protein
MRDLGNLRAGKDHEFYKQDLQAAGLFIGRSK